MTASNRQPFRNLYSVSVLCTDFMSRFYPRCPQTRQYQDELSKTAAQFSILRDDPFFFSLEQSDLMIHQKKQRPLPPRTRLICSRQDHCRQPPWLTVGPWLCSPAASGQPSRYPAEPLPRSPAQRCAARRTSRTKINKQVARFSKPKACQRRADAPLHYSQTAPATPSHSNRRGGLPVNSTTTFSQWFHVVA